MTVPQNPPKSTAVNAPGAPNYFYAANTNGVLYTKHDILQRTPTFAGGVAGADVWRNMTTGVALAAAPLLADQGMIPANGLIDTGNPVVTVIPVTVGGTVLAALPVGTNYVELSIDNLQAASVNYTLNGVAPVTGSVAGQFTVDPGGSAVIASAADIALLRLIAQSATSVSVTATCWLQVPTFG